MKFDYVYDEYGVEFRVVNPSAWRELTRGVLAADGVTVSDSAVYSRLIREAVSVGWVV
jgi:hypothetical protein